MSNSLKRETTADLRPSTSAHDGVGARRTLLIDDNESGEEGGGSRSVAGGGRNLGARARGGNTADEAHNEGEKQLVRGQEMFRLEGAGERCRTYCGQCGDASRWGLTHF
jgi:hypothetical protein